MISQESASTLNKASFRANPYSYTLVYVFACIIALSPACGYPGKYRDEGAENIELPSDSSEQSQKIFAARNPSIESRLGALIITTRMAKPAEVPEEAYKQWLFFPAEGAGSLALGLVAPPMYASALVVGGAILVPLGTYGYVHEKAIWDSINNALSQAEFTPAIDRAMKNRLRGAFEADSMLELQVELVVQVFGIVKSPSERQHCFVVSANLLLSKPDSQSSEYRLQITDSNRSEDAPPPQCASLEHFARNDARLIKGTLAEYAEILAVMAIDRISRESAK